MGPADAVACAPDVRGSIVGANGGSSETWVSNILVYGPQVSEVKESRYRLEWGYI